MLRAILFDLDDTLIDSTAAYAAALRRAGIPAAPYRAARAAVKARLGPVHPSSHNRALYLKEIVDAAGRFSARRVLASIAAYEKALESGIRREWRRSGRARIIARLARRFKIAIVSNETTRTQLLKLRAIDPTGKLFPVVVTSEEIGVEKPDVKVFREAFRRLGVKPSACLMVGDDLRADIAPMRRLGARTWQVRGPKDLNRLEKFIHDLRD